MTPLGYFVVAVFGIIIYFAYFRTSEEERQRVEKNREDQEERALLERGRLEKDRERWQVERTEAEFRQKEQLELVAKRKWKAYHGYLSMTEIADMSGLEFEQFLVRLLPKLSYTDIRLTPINDQGGDIICRSRTGVRTVVQAKRWKSRIGNKAVQEVLAAMLHYDCQAALVITNNTFTRSAIELASKDPRIRLHDYHWLEPMMREHFPVEIPDFSWEKYNAIVVPKLVEISKKPTRVSDVKEKPAEYKRYRKRYWR